MEKHTGISRQSFLIMGTYLFVMLFRSTGLLIAAGTVVSVLLLQGISFLVLPRICKRFQGAQLSFAVVFFAALCAAGIASLTALIPVNGLVSHAFPLPGTIYLLILVPLLTDQANNRKDYPLRLTVRLAGIFIGMFLILSFLREWLGFGTLAGKHLMDSASPVLPLLQHISGAAFLSCFLMIGFLLLFRKLSGRKTVLAISGENSNKAIQPVLVRGDEIRRLQTALLALLILILSSICLIGLEIYLPGDLFPADAVLPVAIVLQAVFAGLMYFILGRNRSILSDYFTNPWVIPVQTAVILLPLSFPISTFMQQEGLIPALIGMLLYLLIAWSIVIAFLLFRRSLRRKLLFGRRPDILSGLPMMLLITALLLMILTGFGAIPQNILTHFHLIT